MNASGASDPAKVCPRCGLPLQLCVCDALAAQHRRLRIRLDARRYGKKVTVVEGFDERDRDTPTLATRLKNDLGTGGTHKGSTIELQGDHRRRLVPQLQQLGYEVEMA